MNTMSLSYEKVTGMLANLGQVSYSVWWWTSWLIICFVAMPPYIFILLLQLLPWLRPFLRPVSDWVEVNTWAKLLVRTGFHQVTYIGGDMLEPYRGRSAQVISNHASWLDIPLIMSVMPNVIRFVTKKELLWVPLLNVTQIARRDIFIDRSRGAEAVKQIGQAMRRLRPHGLWFLSFPEGTRSSDGSVRSFKKTPVYGAIEARIPLIAIAISGTHLAMPKNDWRKKPVHLVVEVVDVIDTVGLDPAEVPRITLDMERRVRAAVERNNAMIDADPPALDALTR